MNFSIHPSLTCTGLMLAVLAAAAPAWGAASFHDPGADRDALPSVPPGFEVTFFAREPMVQQPCSMAFDARGRLCVGMGPQYRNPKPDTPGDSVVFILDDDGDGRADRTKVFATGFNAIQGLAWHGRDLWIANAPDLTVVRDLDGDDVADEYVRLYTDLGNLEHGLHGLNWAPDGKLYMSKGNSKGLTLPGRVAPKPFRDLWGVTAPPGTPDFPPPETFRKGAYRHAYHDPNDDWGMEGGILRCDDDGANLEIVARGFRNPWDIAADDGFHWVGTDNDQTGGDRVFTPTAGAHFGWNHPWSAQWADAPDGPAAPVSGPLFEGSGTGVVFLDSTAFPASHRGVFYINDWMGKTTYLWRPHWDGARLVPAGGTWEPFVRGGPALFRPTDLEVGPDGALWILGWSSGYGAEYRDGRMSNEGRILRVAARPGPGIHRPARRSERPPTERTFAELLGDLDGPMQVCRVEAQDELVRRGPVVIPALMSALSAPSAGTARETWSAWALGRIRTENQDVDDFFVRVLRPEAPSSLNLRLQAIRILAHRIRQFERSSPLPPMVLEQTRSVEPRLRLAAVEAIVQARQKTAVPELVRVLASESDRLVFYSAWQGLRDLGRPFIHASLAHERPGVRRGALLALLEDHRLSVPEAENLAKDSDPAVRGLATAWLGKLQKGGESPNLRGRPLEVEAAPVPASDDHGPAMIRGLVAREPLPLAAPTVPTRVDDAINEVSRGVAARGELLFHHPSGPGCFQCHRLDNHGSAFGPDLAGIGTRVALPHVVQSMLEPNAVITEGFNLHTLETADAELAGILLEESGLSVTLGLANGTRQTVPKKSLRSRRTSPLSAMPAYDAVLSPRDIADLAAYLMSQKAIPSPGSNATTNATSPRPTADSPVFEHVQLEDRLVIRRDGRPVADFVFRDPRILRPYFAGLHAPDGTQVSRSHPPVAGQDSTDHDTMHPGLWFGFGAIAGEDFWRNKATWRHDAFPQPPRLRDGRLEFTAAGSLIRRDGRPLATVTSNIRLVAEPDAHRIDWELVLVPVVDDFAFGDQEEMGFGARVATPLTEKTAGRIVSSTGDRTAAGTWGRAYNWCDYSGLVNGRHAGMALFAGPDNFRPSWWHNRDYGVFVANPFGREAMKQGPKSSVAVPRGEPFRLRYSALLHSTNPARPFDLPAAFRRFASHARP